MAEDKLERFIRDNRERWDDKKAPDNTWANILNKLPQNPESDKKIWKKIALALTLFLAMLILYLILTPRADSSDNQPTQLLEYAEIPDFKETEEFYMSAIFASQQEVYEQHIDATLEQDLSLLDQSTKELREEYLSAQGAYKESILRSIILNHQMKLQILERVLKNIQENETSTYEKVY